MKRTVLIATLTLALTAGFAPQSASANTAPAPQTAKQIYAQAEALRLGKNIARDADTAFEMLNSLANDGYARAQDKLAYYHLRGIGTVPDVAMAEHWYRRAIDSGRDASRVSLAKLLIKQGAHSEALMQLDTAVQAEARGAAVARATFHHDAAFGALSTPKEGTQALSGFAMQGDVRAMQNVLTRISKGSVFDVDETALAEQLLTIARDTENRASGRSAEVLLNYYRLGSGRKAADLRAELLDHPSIRGKIRSAEALYLAHETERPQFNHAASDILSQTPDADFGRAMFIVSRLNKNAYVHVLQQELKSLGYAPGRASGYLTAKTIRAVNAYCRDAGIWPTCAHGPLRSKVVKEVARSIGETRAKEAEQPQL